jgi:HEAT repeats/PQQ-like domain
MPLHNLRRTSALLILLTVLGSSGSLQADEGSDQDEKLLRDARVATDGDGLLNFLRSRTLTDADREKLEQLVRRLGSEVFAEREKATADLIARGPLALPFLKKAKRDPDPEIAHRVEQCLREIATGPGSAESAAVVRQLARRAPAGALVVLLDYVPFADDESVEEEILAALVLLARGKADTVLVKALGDGQPRRRGAAAHVLGRSADKEQRAAVAKLLRDPEMRVRLRAVQGLLAGRDKAAVPALIELLTCEVPDVTWQAEELLVRLAGDKAPDATAGDGSKPARQKQRDAWVDWWRRNADKVDLARMEQEPPTLGLTLIARVDLRTIWEIGRDGKTQWSLSDIDGPIEARVLSGNRILIAENSGNRVTERDRTGKILWKADIGDPALSAQRLPNGNTFIASNAAIREVARDGKEIYHRTLAEVGLGGDRFNAAHRLRDGRVMAIDATGTLVVLEVPAGKIVKRLPKVFGGVYSIEEAPGGHCLVSDYSGGKVVELDAEGKSVWEYSLPGAFHATRLRNGNTLITSHSPGKVIEVDRTKTIVWEQKIDGNVWRAFRR